MAIVAQRGEVLLVPQRVGGDAMLNEPLDDRRVDRGREVMRQIDRVRKMRSEQAGNDLGVQGLQQRLTGVMARRSGRAGIDLPRLDARPTRAIG